MEDREKPGGLFDATYNRLICQEEIGTDEHPLYPKQEKPQVSMSPLRPQSRLNHYKLLAVSLAALAVILLAVDIGLGVYYHKLTDGNHLVMDISREITTLQATYNAAVKSRDEAQTQLDREISEHQVTKWELEHQNKRSKDYVKLGNKIQMEIAALTSHIPMMKEGCRHCLPGWTFMNSMCFYFAISETVSRRSWPEAREFCKRKGGDLAVIDSREKHLAVTELIYNYRDPSRQIVHSGFWIGLRDTEEEGTWKWVDGTRLSEGYWNDGEPNNLDNEDCAAVYPRSNPFKAWNDAPCNFYLKWICEMSPRSAV